MGEEIKEVKINLGCGNAYIPGYVNVDCRKEVNPDMCIDLEISMWPWEDNSVDEIMAFDFLEHIHQDKVVEVMKEIHRILKPGGTLSFQVPSTDGRGAWQDPFHVSYWNLNSFLYYTDSNYRAIYEGMLPKFEIVTPPHNEIVDQNLRIVQVLGVLKKI